MTRFLPILLLAILLLAGCRTITVNITPPRAEVKVDETTMSASNFKLSIYPFSSKKLTISKSECIPVEQTVTFSSPSELNIVLNRKFKASSTPPEADVFLNGTRIGKTTLSFELPANQENAIISFQKAGYKKKDITFSPATHNQVIYAELLSQKTGFQNWSIKPAKYGRATLCPDTIKTEKNAAEPGNRQPIPIVLLFGERLQILNFERMPGNNELLASVLVEKRPTVFSMLPQFLRSLNPAISTTQQKATGYESPFDIGKMQDFLTKGNIGMTPHLLSALLEAQLKPSGFSVLSLLLSILTEPSHEPPKYEAQLVIIPLKIPPKIRRLTKGDIDIAPTTDGSRIFFASNRTGRLDLWKYNLKGDAAPRLHLVHSTELAILATKISPDGDKTLLTVHIPDVANQPQIWSCPLNENKHIIPEYFCDGEYPAWAPSGRHIAFQKGVPSAIWTIDSNGSLQKQLSPQNSLASFKHPAWSPDGKRIAISSNNKSPESQDDYDIWIMDADGSNLTQVTSSLAMDDMPIWAPDGNSIYFRSNRNLHWGIWKIEVPLPSPNK